MGWPTATTWTAPTPSRRGFMRGADAQSISRRRPASADTSAAHAALIGRRDSAVFHCFWLFSFSFDLPSSFLNSPPIDAHAARRVEFPRSSLPRLQGHPLWALLGVRGLRGRFANRPYAASLSLA